MKRSLKRLGRLTGSKAQVLAFRLKKGSGTRHSSAVLSGLCDTEGDFSPYSEDDLVPVVEINRGYVIRSM